MRQVEREFQEALERLNRLMSIPDEEIAEMVRSIRELAEYGPSEDGGQAHGD